jgi:hypothetical protein
MRGNDTNIIVVSEKVKAFAGKLGLWVRKIGRKSLDMFSRLKDFVEENCGNKPTPKLTSISKATRLFRSPGFLSVFQKQ